MDFRSNNDADDEPWNFSTDERIFSRRTMKRNRRRFTLSNQDSYTLEPRHLLTAVNVGLSTEVAPLQNHVGLSIGHAVARPIHDHASAAIAADATSVAITPVVSSTSATNHTGAVTSSHVGQLKDTATGLTFDLSKSVGCVSARAAPSSTSISTITRQPTAPATPTVVSPNATSASSAAVVTKTFTSVEAAAKDWVNTFNGPSITANQEYGSSIYKNPDGTYSYSDPEVGTDHESVVPSPPPNGQALAGVIHSHAAYDPKYGEGNFHFSSGDIAAAKASGVPEYMTNPRGELLLYDLGSGNEVLISTTMPKDPNCP